MNIASEITRLQGVKSDILQSISNKGVTVPAGSALDDCPTLISQISGGGTHKKIYYGGYFWRIGNETIMLDYQNADGRIEFLKPDSDTKFISNAKNIYISYKFKFTDTIMTDKRLLDTSRSAGYRLIASYLESDEGFVTTSLRYNDNGNLYKNYERLLRLSRNTNYKFEHYLDFENNIYQFKVNGHFYVNDSTINAADLRPNQFAPALGAVAGYLYSNLNNGFMLYRDECSYKIDGVEQIPNETLE